MNNDLPSDTTSILIVDSDRNITTLLHDCLAAEGYAVDVYPCAEDALRQPLEGYRMIISEVNLAEISGFELLERLKDAPLTANIPFIFCSEEDSESTVIDALNAGADDYIVK
ncbi:MAG: response regulator, partial [Duncaniella sp.]|nr:response regulator [Duncaniella sp.]